MALEHSTFLEICERAGNTAGLSNTPSIVDFDANNLERTWQILKEFTCLFDSLTRRTLHEMFTQRVFTLGTVADQATYDMDETTSLESITYHSMRCTTSGNERMVNYIPLQKFNEMFPGGTTETGKPMSWTEVIPTAGVVEAENTIRLYPVPDGVYNLEYRAKIVVAPLRNAADKIIFPPAYEDVLIWGGFNLLEQKLQKGEWERYAQSCLQQIRSWASAPKENHMSVSFGGLRINGPTVNEGRVNTWQYW